MKNIGMFLAVAAILMFLASGAFAWNPSTGVVSQYKLDSNTTITDTIGVNNGSLGGTSTLVSGKVGNAITFVDGYIEMANESNFDFLDANNTPTFTISFWLKGTDASVCLWSKHPICNSTSAGIYGGSGGGSGATQTLELREQSSTSTNTNYRTWEAPAPNVFNGTWHHIIYQATGDGNYYLWYDGNKQKMAITASNGSYTGRSDTSNFTINAADGGPGSSTNTYDEFVMYNTTFSDADTNKLYLAGLQPTAYPYAPTTTFSSFIVPNTTDQNITLTCTSTTSGCKTIYYNIDSTGQQSYSDLQSNNFVDTNRVLDYNFNSAVYSVGGITYTLLYTYDFNQNTNSTTKVAFIKSISNKTMESAYNAYAKYKLVFSDGTEEWTSESNNGGTGGIYDSFNYTITSQNKDVDRLELWARNSNSGASTSVKDQNIGIVFGYKYAYPLNFIYSGGGGLHSIQYFSQNNDDTNESVNTSSFNSGGYAHFWFKDENTGAALTGITAAFDDVNYSSGLTTYIDFNLTGITSGQHIFKFYKSGYAMRQYWVDINEYSDFNKTIILQPDTNVQSIDFQFYLSDKTTLLANTYIDVNRSSPIGTAERKQTDADGRVTFTLAPDANYTFRFEYGGTTYTYRGVALTINRPKDEVTNLSITGNWSYEISGGLAALSDTNVSASSKTFLIYGNTELDYRILIDVNNASVDYLSRNYSVRVLGADTSYGLQPYLINATDGADIKFKFVNRATQRPVPNIDISAYKIIGGAKTLVASSRSDVTGTALISMKVGYVYSIDLKEDNVLFYSTDNFLVSTSPVYVYISSSGISIAYTDINTPKVIWSPATERIPAGTTGISQTITGSGVNWASVRVYQYRDANMMTGTTTKYSIAGPCAGACVITEMFASFTYDANKPLFVDLNVYSDSNASVFKQTMKYTGIPLRGADPWGALRNVKTDMGCSLNSALPCGWGIIISIIITALAVAFFIYKFGVTNPFPIIVLGTMILGFFTFIEWFYMPLFALLAIGALFATYRSLTGGGQ